MADIIINLNALYADSDFIDTVHATRAFPSIERWQGSQEEVVLRETTISIG
jgi:hypothetical protein